jgi:hypothetical protein
MELTALLERMKMEHLLAQLDGVCTRPGRPGLQGLLTQALEAEWRGRHQRGVEPAQAGPAAWVKAWTSSTDFQPLIDRKQVRRLAGLSPVSAPRMSSCSARRREGAAGHRARRRAEKPPLGHIPHLKLDGPARLTCEP